MTQRLPGRIIFGLMALLVAATPTFATTLSDLQAQISDLTNKISAAKNQESTLSGEISYLDNQIKLTQLQIQEKQTELDQKQAELDSLNVDIGGLTDRVNNLQSDLSTLAITAVKRFRIDEAIQAAAPFGATVVGGDFTSSANNLTYIKYIEQRDQKLFEEMSTMKNSLDVQKTTLQSKQAQVQQLRDGIKSDQNALVSAQNQLTSQKNSKNYLLAVTKGNEATYKTQLAQAQAQVQAILAFASARFGSGVLLYSHYSPTDSWGTYYNQHDSYWGSVMIGWSNWTISQVGCLVASIAMVYSHYGYSDYTPGVVGANPSNFWSNTAAMLMGVAPPGHYSTSYTYPSLTTSFFSNHLSQGHSIVLGLAYGAYQEPFHWVVLRSISNGVYYINDPGYQNQVNVPLSRNYSGIVISEARVII